VNASKEVELLENSQVKLKITIPGDDVRKEYDELVKEYCQKAHLPGFRRGKVPPEVLIRKLGASLLDETRVHVLEHGIDEVLDSVEQKPLPYETPDVKADNPLELGKDYSFEIVYDTYPTVELGAYDGLDVEEPAWEITEEDIGRELKEIQNQNAVFTDKEEGKLEKGDIANIDYVELEPGGTEKPNTKREAFVFEVGTGYNVYKIDEEIEGMKKGETKIITKAYPEDYETKALAGKSVSLRVTLNSIKEKKLPEINDELAQDISDKFKTLADLKADITNKLSEAVKASLRSQTLNTVLDKVVDGSKIPLPKSLVEYQLSLMWRDYLAQLRIDEKTLLSLLERQGKSVEDIRKDWLPSAEKRAKLQLVIGEIGKKENIQIEEGELDAEITRMAESRKVEADALKEDLSKNNLMDYMKSNLKMDKLYDFILSKTKVKKGKKAKVLDILAAH
jgi:trigger factor